ncbi:tetratricopeptide repeat protein [Alloacidobacterium dinghuense]|nr:tetratricopeptide repeat protein [Alloacidobacterium dinghuense]
MLAQGKLDQSLAELNTLGKQTPEPLGVERLRGFIFYQQSKFVEADAAFAKALAQDPHDTEAMQLRGVTLFRMGKAADAIPLLEQAHASISEANIDPNYVLGVAYMQVGRLDDARHAFAAQYGFPADSAPAYLLAARMFFHQENVPAAHASASKALQLNPSLPLAHQLLGEIALATGDIPGAIAELEKEQQLNPLNGELYDRLGDAYLRNRQFTEAQHALNRAVLLEPNATGPYILLGKLMLNQQNPVMAGMYLERARQMDPANYMTHFLLGQVYRTEGRREDAAREFQTAEQLQSSRSSKMEAPH